MQIRKRMQATRDKSAVRRWTALLLCTALVGSTVSSALPVQAANEGEEETYCEHHLEHTGECGYVEAVAGHPCEHVHNEECGYSEETACTHEHDNTCGYIEAVEEQPCQFICEICEGRPEEVPEEIPKQEEIPSADESIAAEDEVIETTTESVATTTEPMPSTATQEGLIAHFDFNESTNRLQNSAGNNVKAFLYEVESGEYAPGDKIANDNWNSYFDGASENADALHLQNDACLALENIDAFKDLTELTVEMRVKITDVQSQHWLFYATPETDAAMDKTVNCLGIVINENNTNLRAMRNNDSQANGTFPKGALESDKWYTIRTIYRVSSIALYIKDDASDTYTRLDEKGAKYKTADFFSNNDNSAVIWLGHSAFSDNTNFNGYMDDIKIYNYANYENPDGSYLEGYIESYIDVHNVIVEGMNPPNTTVNMFDYWITGQKDNDYLPKLDLNQIRNGGVNQNHLFLFAGYCAAAGGVANSSSAVGSWNSYIYSGAENHQKYEPFQGIVNNVLDSSGYPRLDIEGIRKAGMFLAPSGSWYDDIVKDPGKKTESLAYLFKPVDDESFKAAYPNVTGLFREVDGYYVFRCEETFAELNSDQDR